jgi:nanoRNase/pAp phosphatase (c-di-AMP/oligoRNAs hydrolase)
MDEKTRKTAVSHSKLASVLAAHEGECHVIVLQDFPDPDAISSALAHQLLSAACNIGTDIVYNGRISHQENIALVNLLDIHMTRFQRELDSPYDGVVLIDNQGTTCETILQKLEAADVPILIVVDHHEAQGRVEAEYCDIRPVGATATIYTEYLQEGIVEMDPNDEDHVRVATALMHGLLTDTNQFAEATEADFQAAAFLSHFRDNNLLLKIMNQSRSKQTMSIIHKALGNRLLVENFSIAGVGYLRAESRDVIPQTADFLLTEENVHTVIVYGIVVDDSQNEKLVGSLRSSKVTINPDTFIKETIGADSHGRYYGGGKKTAAGFEVPIGFLSGNEDESYKELKWQTYDTQVKQKILAKINVAEPKSDEAE